MNDSGHEMGGFEGPARHPAHEICGYEAVGIPHVDGLAGIAQRDSNTAKKMKLYKAQKPPRSRAG